MIWAPTERACSRDRERRQATRQAEVSQHTIGRRNFTLYIFKF